MKDTYRQMITNMVGQINSEKMLWRIYSLVQYLWARSEEKNGSNALL